MPRAKNTKKNGKDESADRLAGILLSDEFVEQQKANNWPSLEAKHRAFAEVYVTNGYKHRPAAEEAGFTADRGIGLLRLPLIRAYISHIQDGMYEANVVTRDFVDAKLDELYDMAIGDVAVPMVDPKTCFEFDARKFQGGLALDILREKSKMNGIIKPDIELDDVMGAFANAVKGNLPVPEVDK